MTSPPRASQSASARAIVADRLVDGELLRGREGDLLPGQQVGHQVAAGPAVGRRDRAARAARRSGRRAPRTGARRRAPPRGTPGRRDTCRHGTAAPRGGDRVGRDGTRSTRSPPLPPVDPSAADCRARRSRPSCWPGCWPTAMTICAAWVLDQALADDDRATVYDGLLAAAMASSASAGRAGSGASRGASRQPDHPARPRPRPATARAGGADRRRWPSSPASPASITCSGSSASATS